MDQEASGSTPLFAVFLLSIYSIFLIPYTLIKVFGGDGEEGEVVKTWSSKKDGRKQGLVSRARDRLRQVFSTRLLLMWAAYLLLFWYVSAASKPPERFDPFEILQLAPDATDADIKRAYRRLSLQYHPDKNPDPAATDYFTNHIAKAYKALTDEVSRENFRKYGHPDGPQAMSISVALPEWFFSKDKDAAPVILLTLLLGGIVLPLGLAACYLGRSAQYTGPNEVMQETVAGYWFAPYGVKPNQGVGRLPETLVCAMEYFKLPTTAGQGPALEELRRSLASTYPDLKDSSGPFFKKRRMEIVKAHLLLLAHLARHPVPSALQKDQLYVLQKAPALLQEMFSVATHPRIKPGYGWLTPAVGVVEMMQCLVQAVTTEEKKRQPQLAKSADSPAALLQLPHVDSDVARRLAKRKVRTLPELAALPREERRAVLQGCGLAGFEADEVEEALSALPTAFLAARLEAEGPDGEAVASDDIRGGEGGDLVTCRIKAVLWRPSHMAAGFDPESVKGTAARAYAPNFPHPRDEHWFFLVADPANNALLGWTRVALLQAEAVGARYASNWVHKTTASAVAQLGPGGRAGGGGEDAFDSQEALLEAEGQTVEVMFLAPPPGKHDLYLYAMPDSWLGADRVLPFKLKTVEATRADREGRSGWGAASAAAGGGHKLQRSEESELLGGGGGGGEEVSGGGKGGPPSDEEEGEEGSSEGEEEGDYDSDEIGGTEETSSGGEEEETSSGGEEESEEEG